MVYSWDHLRKEERKRGLEEQEVNEHTLGCKLSGCSWACYNTILSEEEMNHGDEFIG